MFRIYTYFAKYLAKLNRPLSYFTLCKIADCNNSNYISILYIKYYIFKPIKFLFIYF